ncbi:MAG TPA: type IV pilin protein [Burkholderiaceae bacterium]|nr:type IV pilin protein [Burkholderiaceae bacterium]
MKVRRERGFTLVELVIGMLVVAILSAIAMPQYSEYVARQRRIDARTALTLAAQWMERYRAENRGAYTGAALPADYASSPQSGAPLYDLALANVTPTTYRIEATPRVGSPMASDPCAVLTLASDGQRTAAGQTSGTVFDRCWGR